MARLRSPYELPHSRLALAKLPGDAGQTLRGYIEGGLRLRSDGTTTFADSPHNLRIIHKMYRVPVETTPLPNGSNTIAGPRGQYTPKTMWFGDFQHEAFERAKDKRYYALFMDRGTGKSKIGIDIAGYNFAQGRITGVLVVTFKGIHEQWVGAAPDSPLPRHLGNIDGELIAYRAVAWDGKTKAPFALPVNGDMLEFYAQTFPGIDSGPGRVATKAFVERHKGRLMLIIDESHGIANFASTRTENCINLGLHARIRLLMTGSPIAKSPEDEWVQSLCMSEEIFGYRYQVTFRRDYCVMQRGQILQWKNLEAFRATLAPHVYRVDKRDVLGLPEQIWNPFHFELGKEQRRLYDELRRNFLATLRSGEVVTVQNAAVCLLRLQQITCGVLMDEDGTRHMLDNPRADALLNLLQEYPDDKKLIVWCRFVRDIEVASALCSGVGNVAAIYGATPQPVRKAALARFMASDSDLRILVANPAVIGTGTDGLQHVCSDAIYYSNSFNAVERWQSEDRLHRIGTTQHVLYRDLVANNTVDEKILANHRQKKELSEYLLSPVDMTPLAAAPAAYAQVMELLE